MDAAAVGGGRVIADHSIVDHRQLCSRRQRAAAAVLRTVAEADVVACVETADRDSVQRYDCRRAGRVDRAAACSGVVAVEYRGAGDRKGARRVDGSAVRSGGVVGEGHAGQGFLSLTGGCDVEIDRAAVPGSGIVGEGVDRAAAQCQHTGGLQVDRAAVGRLVAGEDGVCAIGEDEFAAGHDSGGGEVAVEVFVLVPRYENGSAPAGFGGYGQVVREGIFAAQRQLAGGGTVGDASACTETDRAAVGGKGGIFGDDAGGGVAHQGDGAVAVEDALRYNHITLAGELVVPPADVERAAELGGVIHEFTVIDVARPKVVGPDEHRTAVRLVGGAGRGFVDAVAFEPDIPGVEHSLLDFDRAAAGPDAVVAEDVVPLEQDVVAGFAVNRHIAVRMDRSGEVLRVVFDKGGVAVGDGQHGAAVAEESAAHAVVAGIVERAISGEKHFAGSGDRRGGAHRHVDRAAAVAPLGDVAVEDDRIGVCGVDLQRTAGEVDRAAVAAGGVDRRIDVGSEDGAPDGVDPGRGVGCCQIVPEGDFSAQVHPASGVDRAAAVAVAGPGGDVALKEHVAVADGQAPGGEDRAAAAAPVVDGVSVPVRAGLHLRSGMGLIADELHVAGDGHRPLVEDRAAAGVGAGSFGDIAGENQSAARTGQRHGSGAAVDAAAADRSGVAGESARPRDRQRAGDHINAAAVLGRVAVDVEAVRQRQAESGRHMDAAAVSGCGVMADHAGVVDAQHRRGGQRDAAAVPRGVSFARRAAERHAVQHQRQFRAGRINAAAGTGCGITVDGAGAVRGDRARIRGEGRGGHHRAAAAGRGGVVADHRTVHHIQACSAGQVHAAAGNRAVRVRNAAAERGAVECDHGCRTRCENHAAVGRAVAAEGALFDRHRFIGVDCAAAVGRGGAVGAVLREGRIDEDELPRGGVVDRSAAVGCGVPGEGAAGHRNFAVALVGAVGADRAAVVRAVSGESAVDHLGLAPVLAGAPVADADCAAVTGCGVFGKDALRDLQVSAVEQDRPADAAVGNGVLRKSDVFNRGDQLRIGVALGHVDRAAAVAAEGDSDNLVLVEQRFAGRGDRDDPLRVDRAAVVVGLIADELDVGRVDVKHGAGLPGDRAAVGIGRRDRLVSLEQDVAAGDGQVAGEEDRAAEPVLVPEGFVVQEPGRIAADQDGVRGASRIDRAAVTHAPVAGDDRAGAGDGQRRSAADVDRAAFSAGFGGGSRLVVAEYRIVAGDGQRGGGPGDCDRAAASGPVAGKARAVPLHIDASGGIDRAAAPGRIVAAVVASGDDQRASGGGVDRSAVPGGIPVVHGDAGQGDGRIGPDVHDPGASVSRRDGAVRFVDGAAVQREAADGHGEVRAYVEHGSAGGSGPGQGVIAAVDIDVRRNRDGGVDVEIICDRDAAGAAGQGSLQLRLVGNRDQRMAVIADADVHGFDRADRIFEIPVAADSGGVDRSGDIRAGDVGQLVDQRLARIVFGEIAAVEQQVAVFGDMLSDGGECVAVLRDVVGVDHFAVQIEVTGVAVGENPDCVILIVGVVEKFVDLVERASVAVEVKDVGVVAELGGDLVRILDFRADDHQFTAAALRLLLRFGGEPDLFFAVVLFGGEILHQGGKFVGIAFGAGVEHIDFGVFTEMGLKPVPEIGVRFGGGDDHGPVDGASVQRLRDPVEDFRAGLVAVEPDYDHIVAGLFRELIRTLRVAEDQNQFGVAGLFGIGAVLCRTGRPRAGGGGGGIRIVVRAGAGCRRILFGFALFGAFGLLCIVGLILRLVGVCGFDGRSGLE